MQSDTENCKICGKVKSGSTKGATITQWISLCQCDMLSKVESGPADSSETPSQTCQTCGKRIETRRSGSLTQWIFRESSCRCDSPQIQTLRLHPETPSRTPEHSSDEAEYSEEQEEDDDDEHDPRDDVFLEKKGGVPAWAKVLLSVLCLLAVAESFFIVFPSTTPPVVKPKKKVVREITEPQMMTRPVSSDIFSLVGRGHLGMKFDGSKIVEVLPCMPAESVGIRKGDRLIAINLKDVEKAESTEINQLLEGEAGTKVRLTLLRGKEKRTIDLERGQNTVGSVPQGLSPEEYYKLGVAKRKKGLPNESRLAFSLAAKDQGLIGKLAKQELRSELPIHYVPYSALNLNNQAYNLLKSGDFPAAKKLFRQCVNRYPNFEWPYLNLAIAINVLDGSLEEPEKLIRKVISINPNHTNAWIAMAMLAEQKGDLNKSKTCMQKARTLNPDADHERANLLHMVEKQKRMAELLKSPDKD